MKYRIALCIAVALAGATVAAESSPIFKSLQRGNVPPASFSRAGGPLAGSVPSPQPGINKIKHVVIIVQENRSFDNLLQGFPGADTQSFGYNSNGQKVKLKPYSLGTGVSPGHLHDDFVMEYNGGAMNGWDTDAAQNGVQASYVYSYVKPNNVKQYFAIGEAYTVGDHFFPTSNGSDFPNLQYLIAAQADKTEDIPQDPGQSRLQAWGCDDPPGTFVTVYDKKTGGSTPPNDPKNPFPCFNYVTMADLLTAKNLESNFYTEPISGDNSKGEPNYGIFNAYDAIEHISCVGGSQPCQRSAYWKKHIISPYQQVLKDVAAGKLGSVTWVTCDIYTTCDHPLETVNTSPQWPASVINAIGASKFWDSTAIFVYWNTWGGFYDHVVPPQLDELGLGFRTPLMVVSPYAKNGYVSHVQHETGSMLRFTEEAFGLNTMGATDSRADDLRDCFDFKQKPQPFKGPF